MRIRFVCSDDGGGGYLRAHWPAEALRAAAVDATSSRSYPPAPEAPDVVIVHRPLTLDRWRKVRDLQDAGALVLVDEDDDLSRGHETGNKILEQLWDHDHSAAHDRAIKEADGLIVATPRLAEVYGHLTSRTTVVRNRVAAWVRDVRFHLRARERAQVRVGWTGVSWTHEEDLRWLAPEAPRALQGALLTHVGDPGISSLLGQVEVEELGVRIPMDNYYLQMARADVGIVPLKPCLFNEAKSWLKALEYLSLGKPVVVTNLPEQRELLADSDAGFLVDTPGDMADAVQQLVRDEGLRAEMGEAARARAAEIGPPRPQEWLGAVGAEVALWSG